MWRKGVGETLRNPIGKPSVGATLAVARGRGKAPPLRTTRYASVGAGVPDGPHTAPPVKLPVIAKPVRTPAVAIRLPRPLGPLA